MGINDALQFVRQTGNQPVPLHLRNAPTELMEELGYGKEYKYAHDFEGHFVRQQYLPDGICQQFWHAQNNPSEAKLKERMERLWGEDKT
jgi:putative ATPase